MPPSYWAEALAAACYLLNRRPSSSIHSEVPYTRLFREQPTYDHLRVFGCLCYPNLQATSAHKLAPRSTACVFLGYPSSHKGYRCLDLSTRRIIISRHVVFDESRFPFADGSPAPDSSLLDFLVDDTVDTMPCSTNPAASPPHGWAFSGGTSGRSVPRGRRAATPSSTACWTRRAWSRAPARSCSIYIFGRVWSRAPARTSASASSGSTGCRWPRPRPTARLCLSPTSADFSAGPCTCCRP